MGEHRYERKRFQLEIIPQARIELPSQYPLCAKRESHEIVIIFTCLIIH